MYFDFEDYRPDIAPVGRAISLREGLFFSMVVHAFVVLYLLFGPALPIGENAAARAARFAVMQQPQERESPRFVFMAPKADLEARKAPPIAEDSDKDREARTRERAPNPTNTMPFSRGNTSERVEGEPPQVARAEPQPDVPASMRDAGGGDREMSRETPAPSNPNAALTVPQTPVTTRRDDVRAAAPGALGEALRNLQRYVHQDTFDNAQGGAGPYGSSIQFDSKGVDFGPWIRRFVAQIKRNWFVPYAAMSLKGHVVMTFYVHKDGSISALAVLQPSDVDSFNNAAYNALATSNPTAPLPPEYPADRAFFTVTFFYNETPP